MARPVTAERAKREPVDRTDMGRADFDPEDRLRQDVGLGYLTPGR